MDGAPLFAAFKQMHLFRRAMKSMLQLAMHSPVPSEQYRQLH